ncbi:hypothetical protein [Alkalitalea saponilacus]|uniref:Uncharacterized protein n=1 Tax=Alkalitalea saponilacus TaxID=889453 RepID=A0A1T5HT18_9BACT|nr:hypothetical protein [Alkalitalea saponilacus]ASB48527.1 hypothetical protein CDL62_04930 [Alkalitalea saponilacus]SKC23849.1 hypothetical protein SAMN03080601_03134 [Alkalitalea saponilacus]
MVKLKIVVIGLFCICGTLTAQIKKAFLRIDNGYTLTNGDLSPLAVILGVGGEYYHTIKSSTGILLTFDGYKSELEKNSLGINAHPWYKDLYVHVSHLGIGPFYSYKFRNTHDKPHFNISLGSGLYKAFATAKLYEGESQLLEKESAMGSRYQKMPWDSHYTDKYRSPWKLNWFMQFGYDYFHPQSRVAFGFYLKYRSNDLLRPYNTITSRALAEEFNHRGSNDILPVKLCVSIKFTGKDKATRKKEKNIRKQFERYEQNFYKSYCVGEGEWYNSRLKSAHNI